MKTLLNHWIVKCGPPICLVTDRGSEYINTDMAHLCTLMGIRHSPCCPLTNGLVEVQNKNLRYKYSDVFTKFPQVLGTPGSYVRFCTQCTTPLWINGSPHELVFHT